MTDREKLVELLDYIRYSQEFSCYDFYDMSDAAESIADFLISKGVTVQEWNSAKEPPKEYRDECMELIPFLVCESGTKYPFRAVYDGKVWGDGWSKIPVTHWMPLPEPPKE